MDQSQLTFANLISVLNFELIEAIPTHIEDEQQQQQQAVEEPDTNNMIQDEVNGTLARHPKKIDLTHMPLFKKWALLGLFFFFKSSQTTVQFYNK